MNTFSLLDAFRTTTVWTWTFFLVSFRLPRMLALDWSGQTYLLDSHSFMHARRTPGIPPFSSENA